MNSTRAPHDPDAKIKSLLIDLPTPPTAAAGTTHVSAVGDLLWVRGVLPMENGRVTPKGRIGLDVPVDQALRATRNATIMALAMLRAHCGTLKDIAHCASFTGFLAGGPDFFEHDRVLDPASALLADVFGTRTPHTRQAIGVLTLPQRASVMFDFCFVK